MTDGLALDSFTTEGLVFVRGEDGDPRFRDLDLGVKCGLSRPRNIRKLIRRMRKAGKLPAINCRSTVERQSTGQGGIRSYMVEEFYPNLAEALAIVAQSGTAIGDALFNDMIRVYIAALKEVADVHNWLRFKAKDTPTGKLAKQLSLWPMGGT